jgi:hypothetical protein
MGIRKAAIESVTGTRLDCDRRVPEPPGGKGTVDNRNPKASTTVLAATKLHIPALRPGSGTAPRSSQR